MENQPLMLGNQDGGTATGTSPAFYVPVKQPPTSGKADHGNLVPNQDSCGTASNAAVPVKLKAKTCLPADCTSGGITVTLDNNTMWNEFYHRNTEMILTKQGRRMFPYCRYWITGLDSNLKYILVMDISPVDNYCYKWNGQSWELSGKAEPHVLGRVFIHPESPSTGHYWMHQPVSFYKLKLTNNTLDQEGHIILHSMHRYLPRLHLVPADKATAVIQLNGPDVHTFTFSQTEFFAVTAYQNIQITQLKIDCNPFAQGFVKDGLKSSGQYKAKQNGRSEHAGFPNNDRCTCSPEAGFLDPEQRGLNGSYNNQKMCNTDLERDTFNSNTSEHDEPELKQETTEFSIAYPGESESDSPVKSPLISNGDINVSIKEEPVDDCDYVPNVSMEKIQLKQEDINKDKDFSCSHDDPILERQLKKHSEMQRRDVEVKSHKRSHNSPLGVAKTKMLKLDSGTMPTASVGPFEVTKSMVKVSALQAILSSCRTDNSFLRHSQNSFPDHFENIVSPIATVDTKIKNLSSGKNEEQQCCLVKDVPCGNIPIHNSHSIKQKPSDFRCMSSAAAKFIIGGKRPNTAKKPVLSTDVESNPSAVLSGPRRRGRPRKLKLSEVKQPLKAIMENHCASLRPYFGHTEFMFDFENVDGFLFVSSESKEGLNNHTVDKSGKTEEPQNEQAALQNTCDSGCQERLSLLETKLLEDLKSLRHKQVIHPSLQEETGLSFISRTGKTGDFRKIKGWQEKFHNTSRLEGSFLESSLKNRSAFCSDKLDEYLESEGKLMETSMGFSAGFSSCPVVHQFSSESGNYVQAQHNIPKKKCTPPASYNFKPFSLPSFKKRRRSKNRKQASSRGSIKSNNSAVPSPVLSKEQHHFQILEDKVTKSQPNSKTDNTVNVLMMPNLDENVQGKQRTVCQSMQNSHIYNNHTKLMELEGCALQDGKLRTYITEERAGFSLTTLFISPALLNNRHDCKVIRGQTAECRVCAGSPLEKSQPIHCSGTECTFDCLKRKMALAKGITIEKPLHGIPTCCNGQEEEWNKWERTNDDFYKADLEQSSINFPMSVKEEEADTKPIFIPAPSATKSTKRAMLPCTEVISPFNKLNPSYDVVKVEQGKTPNSISMFPGQKSAASSIIQHTASPTRANTTEEVEVGLFHLEERKSHIQGTETTELEVTMSNSKPEELLVTQPQSHVKEIMYERNAVTSGIDGKNTEMMEQLSSAVHNFQLETVLADHSYSLKESAEMEQHVKLSEDTSDDISQLAFEEIQGLTSQADKLMDQKQLLMHKRDVLIGKASALSGKTQEEVVFKKLRSLIAKQKAAEAQKQQQQQKQPVDTAETAETARQYVQDGPCSEMKEWILLKREEKPTVLSMTESHVTENEDSFLMPRIVNVMSLAAEEDADLNLDINRNPFVSLASKPSLPIVSQEINFQDVEKAGSYGKERDATGTTKHFIGKKEISLSQMVEVSSLKGSSESFLTELCMEELTQSQSEEKQTGRGGGRQWSKDSSFQALQVNEPQTLGIEMELQNIASAIQDTAPDGSELMDMEENDEGDEILSSFRNEIVFLNQQLNDDASEVSELPNSPSPCFSPGDTESHKGSAAADGSPFQFGPLGGSIKNLCLVQESSGCITPLLLHLEDDSIADCDRTLGQHPSKPGVLELMLDSEVKDSNLDLSTVHIDGSAKHMVPLSKTTHVSPPILKMKNKLEPGKVDTVWKPMPKLAPFGLKPANFPLDSGQ